MQKVAGHTHLHRHDNGRYYFRARVPLELIPQYGGKKEYKRALGTSDYATALLAVRRVAVEFDRQNEFLRASGAGVEVEVTDQQLRELAFELLTERQQRSEKDRSQTPLMPGEVADVLDHLGTEEGYEANLYARGDFMGEGSGHIVRDASRLLERHKIVLKPGGERFLKLCEFIVRANLEYLARERARLRGNRCLGHFANGVRVARRDHTICPAPTAAGLSDALPEPQAHGVLIAFFDVLFEIPIPGVQRDVVLDDGLNITVR